MSILNVEHLSHGFGDRAIFEDVSFRLLKGEHIGLVGANGEGKSTFMNIITGRLMPDEGKIEWAKKVRVGYLDQHTALEKGMTIGSVLSSAFDFLYDMENEMNDIYARLGDVDEDEMNKLMEEAGTIQDMLTMHDFYMIDAKVEEVARALGLLDLGLDKDVTDLSGGQRTKVLMGKLLLEKPDILLLDEPTNYLDVEHIEWLKRYLNDYENAFILISHDIPFLNSVVNLIYHMDNKKLDRYVGDYDKFMEVYEMKKAQLEAAYNKQQQEIKELKDFVARNKARVATRNMAMSRQKKLDKMDVIELAAIVVTSNHGWFSKREINLCPTIPVPPRIPTLSFSLITLISLSSRFSSTMSYVDIKIISNNYVRRLLFQISLVRLSRTTVFIGNILLETLMKNKEKTILN